jgi:Flp pilus assembly protein protease CpaA
MDKNWINNYRLGSYTLFACGLINLRYQWGEPDVLSRSALIFVPGAVFLAATFVPFALKVLGRREVKALSAVLGILLIAYAFSN